MSIGEKLKEWGKEKYGNLTILAQLLDITQPSLSRYINNKTEPGAGILKKLKKLGCNIDWLLSESADLPPPPDTVDRIKELEEENRNLRDYIVKIDLLTQAVKESKEKLKTGKRPFK
jgi:transcriptional regulator with XRE-family HTH domain